MITFYCGNCGKSVDAHDSFAGKTIICTECGTETSVPARGPYTGRTIKETIASMGSRTPNRIPQNLSLTLRATRAGTAYGGTRNGLVALAAIGVVGSLGCAVMYNPIWLGVGLASIVQVSLCQILCDIADCLLVRNQRDEER